MINRLNEQRKGFAITFEIMLTMLLVTIVTSATVYFAQVFETERYFAEVASSTCVMASRYGGNDSNAYKIQVRRGTIADTANRHLAYINSVNKAIELRSPNGDGKFISVSNYPDANNNVTVTVEYKIGGIGWAQLADILHPLEMRHTFVVPSLMQSGKLIR